MSPVLVQAVHPSYPTALSCMREALSFIHSHS